MRHSNLGSDLQARPSCSSPLGLIRPTGSASNRQSLIPSPSLAHTPNTLIHLHARRNQVDLFSTKRGRCKQNTRCFRFDPPNVKTNGCAMKGMGAVTCTRCGYTNLDHEDLGPWKEGEPQLVDERGRGWKFENDVQGGTKRVSVPAPPRPTKNKQVT